MASLRIHGLGGVAAEVAGLKRKLSSKLSPEGSAVKQEWEVSSPQVPRLPIE